MKIKRHIGCKALRLINSRCSVNVNSIEAAECLKGSQVVEPKIYGEQQMIECRCFRI